MADLAYSQASIRSRAGLSRQLQVDKTNLPPDPSRGGARGFPLWFRQQAIVMYHVHGEGGIQNLGCYMQSVRRWLLRDVPYRMTGGKQREALTGVDQMLLYTFIFIYPNTTADACSAYIINNGGAIYTRQQITTREPPLRRTMPIRQIVCYGPIFLDAATPTRGSWCELSDAN
jgi:hypothetical protein